MSIHGPVNVPSQPNWPTSPSHANAIISNKENLLPKTILEGKSSSSPSSLATKKIEKEEVAPLEEKTNDFISKYFRFKRSKRVLELNKTIIAQHVQKIKDKPTDFNLEITTRRCYVRDILVQSAFCDESASKICIQQAQDECAYMQKIAYFNASTHMAAYFLKVHKGISCLNMAVIRDALLTLRRSVVLSSNESKEHAELTEAVSFFETRWKTLKDEGQLDEETYSLLNQNLKQILAEDPFRDEFIKNPELFKQVKNAPEGLLKKYPHLASVSDFLSRYPEAGTIQLLDNLLTVSNLKHCINQVKTSPLPRLLLLVSPESLLTPVHAQMLKDLLIEKQSLAIVFGNEDDATTLTDAFIKDSSLVLDEKSLIGLPKYLDSCGEVFFFSINPEYPVKKKVQPQLEAKKTDSSLQGKPVQSAPPASLPLQGTTELIDGHVFFVLNRESGKKALAVRDYEVEAVKKIKNRTYIDENGIRQEYDIVVFGPEYYEKLDVIEKMIKEKYSPNIDSMLQKHSSKK